MHFGKRCDHLFSEIDAELPPFPYKALKKKLKQLAVAELESRGRAAEDFFSFCTRALQRLDLKWQAACRRVLFAQQNPHAARLLAHLAGLAGATLRDDADRARKLDAWASLAREGLRKLLKKFNKRHAGSLPVRLDSGSLAFCRGPLRSQIEAVARQDADLACPVCLETLFQPVAPSCGHPLCGDCFRRLAKSAAPACPICREPARQPKPMPALAAAARRADPAHFDQRRAADAAAKEAARDAALQAKFAGRWQAHPMALLVTTTQPSAPRPPGAE